ncbi:MAG: ABC transporter permease subunit [Psychromonas sp.]|nr:ABC transporter permease subunit [Psychromonas sp.]
MSINDEFDKKQIRTPLHYIFQIFKKKVAAIIAVWIICTFLFIIIFADFIVSHSPSEQNMNALLLPPYWLKGGNTAYLLGTDELGRDNFSRLIMGIQRTLAGALIITAVVSFFGLILGALASSLKNFKASILHHLLDSLLTIPILLTALIFIVIFGSSFQNCLYAIAISLLPQFIRSIFLSIETEMAKPYIVALKIDSMSDLQLVKNVIYPNILEPLVTIINRVFTMAIIEITTLGFLGFGVQTKGTELGAIIANNFEFMYLSPILVLAPGITLFIIIFSFNVVAEGIRHAIIEAEQ